MAASWVLIPCLVQLRNEFNRIAPNRHKESDGSIGDTAHQNEVSDHNPDETGSVPIHDADHTNEVHALDITSDLNESDLTMEKVVQFILARCRKNNSDPNNEPRLRYIIYNRRIWRAPGWAQEAYHGTSDPHINHAHFSAEYISSLEADTSSWHLEEIPVALTDADKNWIKQQLAAQVEDIFDHKVGHPVWTSRTLKNFLLDVWGVRDVLIQKDSPGAVEKVSNVTATSPLTEIINAAEKTNQEAPQ